MRDVLHSRSKENEQKGDLKAFPQGTLNGNLYTSAHAMAELQLAHPALQALDLTYNLIADRCDGADILARDVTNVFAQLPVWEQFRMMLDAREMVSTVKDAWFNASCVAVYTCYHKDELLAKWVDLQNLKYSNEIYRSCTSTVNDVFMIMYQRASSLETIKNINYGDEFLANGSPDDGPYDILLDIQSIGDVLFTHNDGASEIHFYDMQPVWSYVTNDPDEITPFVPEKPKELDRTARFPVTNGITPAIPKDVVPVFPPKNTKNFEETPPAWSPGPALQPRGWWPSAQAPGEQAWNSIANIACELPIEKQKPQEDVLSLAEQENKQTDEYNTKLDLATEVAVLLASKMSPGEEEKLGIIPRRNVPKEKEDAPVAPYQQETAQQIVAEIIDTEWSSLDAIKAKIQQCVEKFTEGDKGARSKILLKSITQPAEFTKCVFGHLCKEVGDESWRWMYMLRVCKELRKGSWLISNQSIKSSEEVIDEMLNVCTTLKESGALLEHNKTKDHIEDKLMRIKFWNKFAFGVSVVFKWPNDAVDPGIAKQKAREKREYLENVHLQISDDLTFREERNRYLVLQSTETQGWFDADTDSAKRTQAQIEANVASFDKLYETRTKWEKNSVATQLQLNSTAWTIELIQAFVLENIEMWKTANQYTDAMNKRRATTLHLYQASSE